MSASIDITNQRYGKLVAICEVEPAISSGRNVKRWKCKCDCGNEKIVRQADLRSGATVSCGCYIKSIVKNPKTHGQSRTKLYKVYCEMKQRCMNKNNKNYRGYGGRGISICDEWINSFEPFYKWAMKNGYAENLSIDRIDVNGNYCPENCRWATAEMQCINQRIRKDNKTGVKGIRKQGNRYIVQKTINKQKIYIGSYVSLEDAKNALDKFLNEKEL